MSINTSPLLNALFGARPQAPSPADRLPEQASAQKVQARPQPQHAQQAQQLAQKQMAAQPSLHSPRADAAPAKDPANLPRGSLVNIVV